MTAPVYSMLSMCLYRSKTTRTTTAITTTGDYDTDNPKTTMNLNRNWFYVPIADGPICMHVFCCSLRSSSMVLSIRGNGDNTVAILLFIHMVLGIGLCALCFSCRQSIVEKLSENFKKHHCVCELRYTISVFVASIPVYLYIFCVTMNIINHIVLMFDV